MRLRVRLRVRDIESEDGGREGTPLLFRTSQSTQTREITTKPFCKLISYPLILELANIQLRLGWYYSPRFKLQLNSCYNNPMVIIEEVSTPVDPVVLDHPPATINDVMVNLLCHTASIGIPSPGLGVVLKP